jgi:hypothetical protein
VLFHVLQSNNKTQEEKMKKFALTLLASFALAQSAHAATSALVESLLEYDSITSFIGAPTFTVIPQTEFIVDIKRITRQIDVLGEVVYRIVTKGPSDGDLDSDNHCHRHHANSHVYIATLLVSPNPGVGPNIVTVLSIVPVSHLHR